MPAVDFVYPTASKGCTIASACDGSCSFARQVSVFLRQSQFEGFSVRKKEPFPFIGLRYHAFSPPQVLNDLGIVVLQSTGQARAICFGGATASLRCHISLVAGEEASIFPVSFRAWPGAVCLGVLDYFVFEVTSSMLLCIAF